MLTTHYLEEAEELCDQIAIINKGEIIACEPTTQLVGRLDRKDVHLTVKELPSSIPESLQPYEVKFEEPNTIVIRFSPSKSNMIEVLGAARAANLSILDLSTKETDLEEVFLSLTST